MNARSPDPLARAQARIAAAADRGERDQSSAPILEALDAFHGTDLASFAIPAHRQGRAVDRETLRILGDGPFRGDVLMHKGLDDRRASRQVLTLAQELAADAFGADHSFFSTNGSTMSVQVAILGTLRPGDKIIVQRNAHKSAVSGVILSGAEPVWVDPELDSDWRMAHTVSPDTLASTLDRHPDARAAFCVSPSYYGVAADVEGLADVCHRRGVPLLMDDAWGLSFHFHPELPPAALESGADLAIGSFHKALTGLLQTSLISVRGERIDVERLQLAIDSLETTSTSSLLLAAMDGARRHMALHGAEVLGHALDLGRRAAIELAVIPGLRVLRPEMLRRFRVGGLDETKVTVGLDGIGVTGYEAADWLYDQRRVAVEGVDHGHVMFIISPADDDDVIDRLVAAMRDVTDVAPSAGGEHPPLPWAADLLAGAQYPVAPRKAFLGPTRHVKLADAAGEIAADPVSPYPPGVPVLIPGQRISATIVEFLQRIQEEGAYVEGAADPSLGEIRVLA